MVNHEVADGLVRVFEGPIRLLAEEVSRIALMEGSILSVGLAEGIDREIMKDE